MNNIYSVILKIIILAALVSINVACTGMDTFTTAVRPGETVAVGLGWRQYLERNNISISIKDSLNNEVIYAPGNPAVRSVLNTYPDPISNLRVGYMTNQNITGSETIWGTLIEGNVTNYDKDWSQKFVLLDLPQTMAPGSATIKVTVTLPAGGTEVIGVQNYEVLDVNLVGVSSPNGFTNWEGFGAASDALSALARANHNTITFSGTTLPHAIELQLTHAPDMDNGGVGRPYVANPGGDVKSIFWSDDGQNMHVILMPTRDTAITVWSDFKFYVAGEITGLAVVPSSVQAYDVNGFPVTGMNTPLVN